MVSTIFDSKPEIDHTVGLPKDANRTRLHTDDGIHVYLDRGCPKWETHDAHEWVSHWYGYNRDAKPNAYCKGRTEKYAPKSYPGYTAWTPKPKKDYSADDEFAVSDPITLSQARRIAHHMHRTDVDKIGHAYSEHLNAVEQGVRLFGGSVEERIAALFHDSVEDGHTTFDLLRKIHVTEATIDMIEAVTKRSGEEQGKYLARVVAGGEGAMRVKLADLIHNTRHDRLQALRDDKRGYVADRLLKKYRPSIARLMLELGMIVDEDEQKKLATKPQGSAYGSTTWTSAKHTATTKPKSGVSVSKEVNRIDDPADPEEGSFLCNGDGLQVDDFVIKSFTRNKAGLLVEGEAYESCIADIEHWTDEDSDLEKDTLALTFLNGRYVVVGSDDEFRVC